MIQLTIRRLFCDSPDCTKTTFAEQAPELAARYARRTAILQRVFCTVGLALGGRVGARLTRHLAASVSRMTLLRLKCVACPTRTIAVLPGRDVSGPLTS